MKFIIMALNFDFGNTGILKEKLKQALLPKIQWENGMLTFNVKFKIKDPTEKDRSVLIWV